jgi:hypothetical protein
VVVFVIGGFTYEEAAAVQALNASLGLQVSDRGFQAMLVLSGVILQVSFIRDL